MNPAPRAPFDQGLFLTHFNRGKALYEERKFQEAERELEEAYLLRPRDQNVLNLLGLVYFKQDKLEKAEEVYRKLAAESPDVSTLYYNLGLIHFKLSRLEEAEMAFLKALDLAKDNHKINFYLGSVYERMQRYPDAIFQYRQAGAHLMVRRVEDKMAAAPAAAPNASTIAPAPRRPRKPDDTAEFKVDEIRQKMRARSEETLGAPAKPVQPVGSNVLAEQAPGRLDSDTARFRVTETTIPPRRTSDVLSFPQLGGTDQTVPPREAPARPADTFRFLENNLMEIQFSGKVFIKQGTVYSYGGNLTFWVKDKRPGGTPALVIVTGVGKVILTDKDREITFLHVENETIFIEPNHLLACEETLTPRYVPVGEGSGLEFLALEGAGMVALSAATKPLALPVTPDLPVSVPAASIISWTGALTPAVVDDHQLQEVMLSPATGPPALLRLEGKGRLLVEQALT